MSDHAINFQFTTRAAQRHCPAGDPSGGIANGLCQETARNVHRRASIEPETRIQETVERFCTRREHQELVLAASASNQNVRDIHYALANAYREKLEQFQLRRTG